MKPATDAATAAIKAQANAIKIGAVLTAIPRWVTALLWAEGFALPDPWLVWWVPVSALLSMAMAAVEGFAFAFAFSVWASKRRANGLLFAALLTAALFVGVLTPSIAAGVRGVPIGAILTHDGVLLLWSVAVAASTIGIVISVGYAQRIATMDEPQPAQPQPHVRIVREEQPQLEAQPAPALPEPQVVARKADWLAIRAGLNGDGHDLDAAGVAGLLEQAGFALPSPRTLQGWAKETQE